MASKRSVGDEGSAATKRSHPRPIDPDGNLVDPRTELHLRARRPGEPVRDSIFAVPRDYKSNERIERLTVQGMLDMIENAGLYDMCDVTTIFDLRGPHPNSLPKQFPPTDCKICSAINALQEREKGYSMLELRHAGLFGCKTCATLYRGLEHFANMFLGLYDIWETSVVQRTIGNSGLLAEAHEISVTFRGSSESFKTLELKCEGESLHIKNSAETRIRARLP